MIPTELMFEEVRVLRNKERPATSDRDISALNYLRVLQSEPIIWKYLTDPKMWALLTDLNEDEGFVTVERIAFKHKQWGDDRTGNYFVTARERYGSGWRNPRCAFIVSPTWSHLPVDHLFRHVGVGDLHDFHHEAFERRRIGLSGSGRSGSSRSRTARRRADATARRP